MAAAGMLLLLLAVNVAAAPRTPLAADRLEPIGKVAVRGAETSRPDVSKLLRGGRGGGGGEEEGGRWRRRRGGGWLLKMNAEVFVNQCEWAEPC